jgi:cysteine desulfurase
MRVYLDNAATTPLDPQVIDEMANVMKKNFGNPSSIHGFGRETKVLIENARKKVAGFLNVSPGEIIFTSGGTEANNTAIYCSVHDLGIKHAITSPIEHHAVLHSLENLAENGKIKLSFVKLEKSGHIDLNHLEELLKTNPRSLVSLMHANNEIGNMLPIKKVSNLGRENNAVFHSDTVQSMAHYTMNLQETDVDFINCAAHKFHGPKGVGFLYINSKIKIKPFIHGGSQERNMRGGTENLYGIVGLAKAMEIAYSGLNEHQAHIRNIKNYMINRLKDEIAGIEFNGDSASENSLYTVLNVCFPPTDHAEMFLFNLDIYGIAASGGSACASGSNQGSHVLKAIECDMSRPSVRFSFSKYTKKEEIDFCVEKLKASYPSLIQS